jgi:hypothetical protein
MLEMTNFYQFPFRYENILLVFKDPAMAYHLLNFFVKSDVGIFPGVYQFFASADYLLRHSP